MTTTDQLYVVQYNDQQLEFFVATSQQHALDQFATLAKEKELDIQDSPTARQTYIETYQQTPEGAYGPRPRLPEENHVLMSPPTVGCCGYMACGQHEHSETSGKPVSEAESEPAERPA